MQKAALVIFVSLLIAGPSAQVASASQKHQRKHHVSTAFVPDDGNFRGAYDAPYGYLASRGYIPPGLEAERERNLEDFGLSGWDPTRPGDFDPSLRPSD
jgi:hypothetical protein